MIERSPEVAEFKARLHKLSKQRFSAEITDEKMRDTLLKMLEQQTRPESKKKSPAAAPQVGASGAVEDDIGAVMKAVLVGIMLVAVGLIIAGLMQH